MFDFSFYRNKRVLVTGHTGFKGSWLCEILHILGADVTGYALEPQQEESLYELADIGNRVNSNIGDIRDLDELLRTFKKNSPEIVIHMAAQPLVRQSYEMPVYTYETNVIGTVNVLECIRMTEGVKSFVNVTTDKVYENLESDRPYVETDRLDGYDPYSNSKSCSELVTHCYQQSFLKEKGVAVSTCRAGNVIGGGDFAKDRIIPDCVRAALKGEEIRLRNPAAIRPFQHVIEPLFAYLLIAMEQYKNIEKADTYNIGPDENNCITTEKLVSLFCDKWQENVSWKRCRSNSEPHEAGILKLDSTKLKERLGWTPKWNIEMTINKVVEWEKAHSNGKSVNRIMDKQIREYMMI